ncbi:MAG: DUF4955 domain-containing protein [Cyclobacteriaceae bacterium]
MTLILLTSIVKIDAQTDTARIWKKYKQQIDDESIPLLPDYSYAGYKLGEESIPDRKDLKVFDVTKFGAIADDTLSDQESIQKAIAAAESNGGGIVYFPKGEFYIVTDSNQTNQITITQSNIILRGSGSAKGGTVLNWRNHMLLPEGKQKWHTPSLFHFSGKNTSGVSKLTKSSKRGSLSIYVEDISVFEGQKFIELKLPPNREIVSEYLDAKKPRETWLSIAEQGLDLIEYHEISSLDSENQIIFIKDPIVDDINHQHGWEVSPVNMIEQVGLEDLHIMGNFLSEFKHHLNYIHDYAWHAIDMSRVAHSWVRRSRFSNVSQAAKMSDSYASSIISIVVDGNRGHALSAAHRSSRILQGLIYDITNQGQWHGADMSSRTSGSVVWRVTQVNGRGFDLHASGSRTNLVDRYQSDGFAGQGGFYGNLPHHLTGLTLWNNKRTGKSTKHNFWFDCGANYCGLTVANPIVVGYHGSETTFDPENILHEESNGSPIYPMSLYEAQLENRLGYLPSWVKAEVKWSKKLHKSLSLD